MKNETDGEKVWRLFAPTINHYVDRFFAAEVQWQDKLVRHINPLLDMPFVSGMPRRDRIWFWLDKMYLLYQSNAIHLLTFFVSRQYNSLWFTAPGTPNGELQQEFLYVLLLFMATERPLPSEWLTRQLRRRFSPHLFLDSLTEPFPQNASSDDDCLTQTPAEFLEVR